MNVQCPSGGSSHVGVHFGQAAEWCPARLAQASSYDTSLFVWNGRFFDVPGAQIPI